MLSFAFGPPVKVPFSASLDTPLAIGVEAVVAGVPFVRGAAEGIFAVCGRRK